MKKKVLVTRAVFDETLAYLAQHFEVASNQADAKYHPTSWPPSSRGWMRRSSLSTDRVDDALLSHCPSVKARVQRERRLQPHRRRRLHAARGDGYQYAGRADQQRGRFRGLPDARHVPAPDRRRSLAARGEWEGTHLKELLGVDLHHATVGICGFGRIGQAIAQRLQGFEPKILYTSRNRVAPEIERG